MDNLKKNILLISTGDVNGAYEAIYRLAKHLYLQGHHVKMLVKSKTKSDDFVVVYNDLDSNKKNVFVRIFLKIIRKIKIKYKKKSIKFDPEYNFISKDETSKNVSAGKIVRLIGFSPDIIYTGMTDGFMNSTDLLHLQQLTKAQVYNITVDMNHFTGGCHYAWDCKGYIDGCTTSCPAVVSKKGKKIPKINFETKLKNAKLGNFKIIAGSGWTLKQAQESKIYKNQIIIYSVNSLIDTTLFNNKNRDIAKRIFNLNSQKFYILTGSQTAKAKRKGFEYLVEALQILEKEITEDEKNKIEILVVSRKNHDAFNTITFQKQFIDYINDYRLLSLLYQATDVFINPSIEDSGPMMVSEALACGTPVVGFDMGVVNNMVVNGFNGYKAKLKESSDLAKGIIQIFNLTKEEYNVYSKNAYQSVLEYSSMDYANKIFDEIHKSNS